MDKDKDEEERMSIAFNAGIEAARMKIPIEHSAIRKLRPGTSQYDDFLRGYDYCVENKLDKQK